MKNSKDQAFNLNVKGDIVRPFNLSAKKKKNNPWAICNKSVGQDDKAKFERCVMDVKKSSD